MSRFRNIRKRAFCLDVYKRQALHRVSALASLGLDSLPHNGLVVSVLNVTENNHKQSYFPIFVTTCVIPLLTLVFLIALFYAFGMA